MVATQTGSTYGFQAITTHPTGMFSCNHGKIPSKGTRSSQVVLFTLKTVISKIMDVMNVCISVGQVKHYDLNLEIITMSEVGNERFTIASHPEGVRLRKTQDRHHFLLFEFSLTPANLLSALYVLFKVIFQPARPPFS